VSVIFQRKNGGAADKTTFVLNENQRVKLRFGFENIPNYKESSATLLFFKYLERPPSPMEKEQRCLRKIHITFRKNRRNP
jgi:hypothetical protein